MKGQYHLKLASLPNHAAHFNSAVVFFYDAAGERKTQAGTVAFGGVEGAEDVCQVLRKDAATGVADDHTSAIISRTYLDAHGARPLYRLHCIQEQIQKHLVDLIAVVLDFRQLGS